MRTELVKKIIQSHQEGDDELFRRIAEKIIATEKSKGNLIAASELEKALNIAPAPVKERFGIDGLASISECKQASLRACFLDPDVKETLARIITENKSRDLLSEAGLVPTRKVLFCGPPGCGKTSVAKAIAAELELPLLIVRIDAIVNSLLGETASNLRKVFESTNRGQCVIFFDEFDAIARSRTQANEHGEIKRVVNSLLQLFDEFQRDSLIVAATNLNQSLDPALFRRFDEIIALEKPTNTQLTEFVKSKLSPLKFRKDLLTELVERSLDLGCSYADAEMLCLGIRKVLTLEGRSQITSRDCWLAIHQLKRRRSIVRQVKFQD